VQSEALGVGDGQQAGFGQVAGGHSHALLWTGDAASMVDLHPAGFNSSAALGVSGGQQVGSATDHSGTEHALLWAGNAGSVVDLSPAGLALSRANGVAGGQQVGFTALSRLNIVFGATHAIVWTGSAASAVDLNSFLPAPYFAGAAANGIDDAGNIVGSAAHVVPARYFPRIETHAILWEPVLPYGLDISEAAGPDPVNPGDEISYAITVTNSRSGTATGVLVTDTIFAGTLVSATTDHGSCSGSNNVTCDLGAFPGGSAAHIALVVQVPQGFFGSSITNRASVEADNLMTTSAGVITAVRHPSDITGSWQSVTQTCKTRHRRVTSCSVKGNFVVINQGTAATGPFVVRFYLSDDMSFDAGDVFLAEVNVPSLGPGTQKLLKEKALLSAGSSASGKFVIAVLDATGVVAETNETNNNIASARLP
jgi:uncharacterized repeat protein (TIGR01451 family)